MRQLQQHPSADVVPVNFAQDRGDAGAGDLGTKVPHVESKCDFILSENFQPFVLQNGFEFVGRQQRDRGTESVRTEVGADCVENDAEQLLNLQPCRDVEVRVFVDQVVLHNKEPKLTNQNWSLVVHDDGLDNRLQVLFLVEAN